MGYTRLGSRLGVWEKYGDARIGGTFGGAGDVGDEVMPGTAD
jgi:hypothetical protein